MPPKSRSAAVTAGRSAWRIDDARDLYQLPAWSDGFFGINEAGHVCVTPLEDQGLAIDILHVVEEARRRGIALPLLIRFQDILRTRVRRLYRAFQNAIEESGYGNVYRGVYPVKVNQLEEVVAEVLEAGGEFGIGLESGSKAELIATLPYLRDDETLLICNGVKDHSMLRLILQAQRLGRNALPVIEKSSEFRQLLAVAAELDIEPRLGVRVRLATSGAGRWAESGGYRSKFGVSIPELLDIVDELEQRGQTDALQLLHFHLGSQIEDIQVLKQATKEVTQVYARLLQRGLGLRYLDVGGGLGVSYDAGGSPDSINYSLQEYADAVVYSVQDVCAAQAVPEPVLVSESGRAITAHHSVLVVEALGAYEREVLPPDFQPPAQAPPVVAGLVECRAELLAATAGELSLSDLAAICHDVEEARREANMLFGLGHLPLEELGLVDRLYWSCCDMLLAAFRRQDPDPQPKEMQALEESLVDRYLCNFSVFQSMLDHWAIEQRFPVMPLARLDEPPTRRAMIVDLTCDSDGKIHRYVSANPDTSYLALHPLRPAEPYYLGVFLMGAYQDIMGDAHNLFGRVPEVHVYASADETDNYWIETVLPGDSVEDILAEVQYFRQNLQRRMNEIVREKISAGMLRPTAGMEIVNDYVRCFGQTTYCQTD